MPEGSANVFRDILVVQDHIKYVEHECEIEAQSYNNGAFVSNNWKITVWSRRFTPNRWQGRWTGFDRDASRISGSLPELLGMERNTPLPPLQRLHTGHPILSLDENDVVYILAKIDHRDEKAFVVAVNVKDGTLQAAGYFNAERTIGISYTYTQYRTCNFSLTHTHTILT